MNASKISHRPWWRQPLFHFLVIGALLSAEASANDATWRGPVASPFGHHLVRVTDVEQSTVPTFAEARTKVHSDMLAERRKRAARQAWATLCEKYSVQMEVEP